jgi:hypothetical protein
MPDFASPQALITEPSIPKHQVFPVDNRTHMALARPYAGGRIAVEGQPPSAVQAEVGKIRGRAWLHSLPKNSFAEKP